jgi:hypothetical protein
MKITRVNIDEDVMQKMAEDMAREIDFDVLAHALEESGWTRVEFVPFIYEKRPELIEAWVGKYATGEWHNAGTKFVFERTEDASAAILQWK